MKIVDTHPSLTERRTMKIVELATGLVLERQPPDAHAMVASGAFTFAPADTPSVADALRTMGPEALEALIRTASPEAIAAAPRVAHTATMADSQTEYLVARLVRLVEAGAVTLP